MAGLRRSVPDTALVFDVSVGAGHLELPPYASQHPAPVECQPGETGAEDALTLKLAGSTPSWLNKA